MSKIRHGVKRMCPVSVLLPFTALRAAHKALAAQIAPKVYEYGFLKR